MTINNPTRVVNHYQTRVVRGRTVRVPVTRTIVRKTVVVKTVSAPQKPAVINNIFNTPPAKPAPTLAAARERKNGMSPLVIWLMVLGTIAFVALCLGLISWLYQRGQRTRADAAAARIGILRDQTGEDDPPAPAGPSRGWAKQKHYDHAGRLIYVRKDEWPIVQQEVVVESQQQNCCCQNPGGTIAEPAAILSAEGLRQLTDINVNIQDPNQTI